MRSICAGVFLFAQTWRIKQVGQALGKCTRGIMSSSKGMPLVTPRTRATKSKDRPLTALLSWNQPLTAYCAVPQYAHHLF